MKTKKQQVDWKIVCFGITAITGLMAYALSLGMNGLLLTSVIGLIAVAIGVTIPTPQILKK